MAITEVRLSKDDREAIGLLCGYIVQSVMTVAEVSATGSPNKNYVAESRKIVMSGFDGPIIHWVETGRMPSEDDE